MSKKELAKTYNPSGMEDAIYQSWMDKGYFHAKVNPDKKPFTIVMPPPNVTGQLHMGHALDNTLQDMTSMRSAARNSWSIAGTGRESTAAVS